MPHLINNEKIVVIVPAHNEEGYINQVVKPLLSAMKLGIINDFRVIPNGCTDLTIREAEIAGAAGKMIILPRKGKGRAFVEGALWAKSVGATVMLTFDADLFAFKPKQLLPLIYPVMYGKTRVAMSIASMNEIKHGTNQVLRNPKSSLSGIRAIRLTALNPLFAGNRRWRAILGKEYHLEVALTDTIRSHAFVDPNIIARRAAYRGSPALSFQQRKDIHSVRKYMQGRQKRAQILRAQRNRRALPLPPQARVHGRN